MEFCEFGHLKQFQYSFQESFLCPPSPSIEKALRLSSRIISGNSFCGTWTIHKAFLSKALASFLPFFVCLGTSFYFSPFRSKKILKSYDGSHSKINFSNLAKVQVLSFPILLTLSLLLALFHMFSHFFSLMLINLKTIFNGFKTVILPFFLSLFHISHRIFLS